MNHIKLDYSQSANTATMKLPSSALIALPRFDIQCLFTSTSLMLDILYLPGRLGFSSYNMYLYCPNFRTNELKVWTVLSTDDR